MITSKQLESKLDDLFEKNGPKLPANARKTLVKYAPWVSLAVGVLTLWGVLVLWQWATAANAIIDYANQFCAAYNTCVAPESRLTMWIWLDLIVLAAQGALYLLAFPGLRTQKKQGWNYLYWGALVNVAYALVSLLSGYSGITGFVGALIGSAIGLWLLFQVRSNYTGERAARVKAK